jgi:hypothetical protein
MIIKIPKLHQDAVKYACEVYAVPVRFYTDERNEGLVRVDIDITAEEAWLISAEAQMKLREESIKRVQKNSDDLFNFFKIGF